MPSGAPEMSARIQTLIVLVLAMAGFVALWLFLRPLAVFLMWLLVAAAIAAALAALVFVIVLFAQEASRQRPRPVRQRGRSRGRTMGGKPRAGQTPHSAGGPTFLQRPRDPDARRKL